MKEEVEQVWLSSLLKLIKTISIGVLNFFIISNILELIHLTTLVLPVDFVGLCVRHKNVVCVAGYFTHT